MKSGKMAWGIVVILVAIPLAYAMYLYPQLPASIPTHFGIDGKPDAYGSRSSVFTAPAIMGFVAIVMYSLLSNLQRIDPKRTSKVDGSVFRIFGLVMAAFLSSIALGILYATSHPGEFSFEQFLLPALGLLFMVMGWFMPRFKQNYFVGLRLPWTLDNEANWNATHQLGGKVWMVGGALLFVLGFLLKGVAAVVVLFVIITIMVAIPIGFSFLMFRKGNQVM